MPEIKRRIVIRSGVRTIYAGEASSEGSSANWRDFLPSPPQDGEWYDLIEMEVGGRGEEGLFVVQYEGQIKDGAYLTSADSISLDREQLDQLKQLLESSETDLKKTRA